MIRPAKCLGVIGSGVLHCTELFPSLYNFILSLQKRHLAVNVLVLVATFHADRNANVAIINHIFLKCALKTMNQGKTIKPHPYHNIKGYHIM